MSDPAIKEEENIIKSVSWDKEPVEHDSGGVSGSLYGSGNVKYKPPSPVNAEGFDAENARTSDSGKSQQRNCFFAIFATRQLAPKGNRELYIKYSVRELIIFTLYLAIFCAMVFINFSSSNFYFTKVMRDLFVDKPIDLYADEIKTFETSTDVRDFWKFVNGSMLDSLYAKDWYGNQDLKPRSTRHTQTVTVKKGRDHGILYENQMMGVPRLRQIRVVPAHCPVADNFRQLHTICYPEYTAKYEDKGDKNGRWSGSPITSIQKIKDAWKYQKGAGGSLHWGHLSWYPGGGAVLNLERRFGSSQKLVAGLREHLWITRGTRVVFLDFTVYNANINLFCVVKLVWEFPATGGILTSHSFRTVKLIRYQTPIELYIVFPSEIIFIVFTVYYLIQELLEMYHVGFPGYLFDLWSWLDVTILITSFVCIGFSFYRYLLVEETLGALTEDMEKFQNFEFLGYWETQFSHTVSVCLFFSWVKVFKYISFNKTMTQLSSTLSRCAKDIGGFAIMFFIVFFAFAQLGYLLFGSQVEDFSTFIGATFTLLRLILGDFNFRQIEEANRALGPIYFLAYVFFVFFVLLNMFLAIINDTYSEVKAEILAQRNEFEIVDYFKRLGNNIRGKIGKRDTKLDAEAAIKLAAADGQITYDELRENLQRSEFNDVEIELFLARFDLDQDRALDEEETQQVLHDLEGQRTNPYRGQEQAHYHSGAELLDSSFTPMSHRVSISPSEDFTGVLQRVQVIETALTEFIHTTSEILENVQGRVTQSEVKVRKRSIIEQE